MSNDDLVKIHTDVCLSKSCLATRSASLLDHADVLKEVVVGNDISQNNTRTAATAANVAAATRSMEKKRQRLDEFMTRMSSDCLILSDHVLSKWTVDAQEKLLRRKANSSILVVRKNYTGSDIKNGGADSLMDKFASFTISRNLKEDSVTARNRRQVPEEDDLCMNLAAQFLSQQVGPRTSLGDSSTVLSSQSHTKEGNQSNSSRLLKLPSQALGKATSIMTSILARYDLMESPHDALDTYHHDALNEDDAYRQGDDGIEDVDDANVASNLNHGEKPFKFSSNAASNAGGPTTILESDMLWSVRLLKDCFNLILDHARERIKNLQGGCIGYDCHELTTVQSASGHTIAQGLVLNRKSNDETSFLAFCRSAEELSESGERRHILSRMEVGFALDLLMLTMFHTRQATLSSDGSLIVVHPHDSLIGAFQEFVLNEIHMALFKLCSTKKMMETRINKLTAQADDLKEQALKQKKMGNKKLALTYLKRKQVIMNEVDLCSSSLLNLETAYIALDRSGTDIELFKIYELIQKTMKQVKEENGLDQSMVENVMDEVAEENEEMQRASDALAYMGIGFDDAELEKELMTLHKESGNPSDAPSSGGQVNVVTTSVNNNSHLQTLTSDSSSSNHIPAVKEKNISELMG